MIPMTTPPVPQEALEYFRAKGYEISWDYWEVWREEHVRAFTVAKAMTQDLLIDIRKALDESLSEGKTLEQFKKELVPILAQRGWLGKTVMPDGSVIELGTPRRLKLIYDTNMRTARAAGQWERIHRNKAVLPYLMYGLGPSKEHRLQHVDWDGVVLPVDDAFWDTHLPPNGWGCRCRVRQLTQSDAQRRGINERPVSEKVAWKNKKTGKIQEVPKGIDPGWDYHAGKTRLETMKQFSKDKDLEFRRELNPTK